MTITATFYQKVDARLVTTNNAYDSLNRIISRDYSDGTPGVTYRYDPNIANGKGTFGLNKFRCFGLQLQ